MYMLRRKIQRIYMKVYHPKYVISWKRIPQSEMNLLFIVYPTLSETTCTRSFSFNARILRTTVTANVHRLWPRQKDEERIEKAFLEQSMYRCWGKKERGRPVDAKPARHDRIMLAHCPAVDWLISSGRLTKPHRCCVRDWLAVIGPIDKYDRDRHRSSIKVINGSTRP